MMFFGFHHAWLHAATYTLDPPHTSIGFSVKHLMITDVSGQFKTYEAKVELDEKTNELKGVEANIRVSSIDTENAKRDGHLKSPDFFDAGMMGGKRAGFSATAMINRKDFGLNWNRSLDQGGLLVGNEVTIELKIQAVAST